MRTVINIEVPDSEFINPENSCIQVLLRNGLRRLCSRCSRTLRLIPVKMGAIVRRWVRFRFHFWPSAPPLADGRVLWLIAQLKESIY